MTDQPPLWYALPRHKINKEKSNKAPKSFLPLPSKQKAFTFKDFEFNPGSKVKQIKLVSDQQNISDRNRYPELVAEHYTLFKSLTDKYKITVDQKKANRERIRRKLWEINNPQVQATARFETENQESDFINLHSPDQHSHSPDTHLYEASMGKSGKESSQGKYGRQTGANSTQVNTTNISKLSKYAMNNIVIGSHNKPLLDRSSNNDILADRDFSIATSSVQSSVLKSSKFLVDKAQHRGDRENQPSASNKTDEKRYKRKVIIDESKSTPKDSSSQKDKDEMVPQQSSEPAVQYSKKNTIRRFSTLKNDDNYQAAQKLTKKQLPESDSDNNTKKHKIKRGKTQKGDPGKAFPAESSDNGITLCKISESCLEELSIVESEDLYGSERPCDRQREYDERIQRKIQEGKQFQKQQQNVTNANNQNNKGSNQQIQSLNSKNIQSQQQNKAGGLKAKSNEPKKQLQEMNKNEGNTRQNVFFKKLGQQNNAKGGPQSDFISIGSSSEFGMGKQSNLGMKYGKSREKLSIKSRGIRDKRDSSSYLDSNYSSHSGPHLSIGKSQGSYVKTRDKKTMSQQRDPYHAATKQPPPPKTNITVNDQKSNLSRQDDSILRKGPSDGQSINSSSDPRSLPRNSEGFFSSENSPLIPQSQKQKAQNSGVNSTRSRVQSLNAKQNKTLPKLPGIKLQHKREQPKKKKVLSKELAQVTEKDEYDYSPMKSNVTQDNLNFELAVRKHKQQNKSKDFKELDKQLLDNQDKTGNVKFDDSQKQRNRHGSDYNLKKVHSIEDTESHQFEDSLMEQSSPNVDTKDMPYGNDQTSLNGTTNIQLCNQSGSYHVQQMTISSQDHNMTASMAKRRIARKKKKSPQKAKQSKDGNFRNIRDYQMFIPNQPSVSQVQGKSRLYLAVSDPVGREQNTSISKSSARRLLQQSDLQNLMYPQREQINLRNQMCISMTSSHKASKKLSPNVSKADKQPSYNKNNTTNVNRSVIQKQKTDGSLGSYKTTNVDQNLTDRRNARPIFQKMLTQKENANRIDSYNPSEATLKKQKTQFVTDKERKASDRSKQPPGRVTQDHTLNQIMFAQQAYLNDTNFEKYMIEQVIKNDKSKSHLKSKKPVANSAFKNSALNMKGKRPSRTDEKWRPAGRLVQDTQTDGDIGYLENLAASGNEPYQNMSPEPKVEAQDQIYVNQNYSSIHSSTKINRKSMDSLSNKNIQKRMVADNNLFFQGVKSAMNNHSLLKSPHTTGQSVSDLPLVGKQNISVAKRAKKLNSKNYADNAVVPSQLMPSIDKQRKLQKSPRIDRRSNLSYQMNSSYKQNNQEILKIIKGLCNATHQSRAGALDRHGTDHANGAEATKHGVMYYNDLFTGELRVGQRKDAKFMPLIDAQRRIGGYGHKVNVTDELRNKRSLDLDHQRKALASRQRPNCYNILATEEARASKQVSTITKLSPQRARGGSNKLPGGSYARYAGDPYSVPMPYFQPGAPNPVTDPRGIFNQTQTKFNYNFNLKPIKMHNASPFHASGGNQISQNPEVLHGFYRPILNQDSKEGSFLDFGQAIIARSDAAKSNLMSGSLIIPSNMSKASCLSSQKRKLKPIEGVDKDKGIQSNQFQKYIDSKKGTFSGGNELSMSPSSRHSRRIHLNQSIDLCYFNPEVSHMIMNSSVAIVRNKSNETEEDAEVSTKKKKQQSQMSVSRDREMAVAQRSPLIPEGRAIVLQGRQEAHEYPPQQQNKEHISLYFNHIQSQRSRTSQQNSRRTKIRPSETRNGMSNISSGLVNNSQIPGALPDTKNATPANPPLDGHTSPRTEQHQLRSETEDPQLVDTKRLIQNDSTDKIERMQQQIQRMNLSELKFEMLTSNRSWRSGLGKTAVQGVQASRIPKGAKMYFNKQMAAPNHKRGLA